MASPTYAIKQGQPFIRPLLIKDPGATTRTGWHHDATYWPVTGDQISTMWLALDPVMKPGRSNISRVPISGETLSCSKLQSGRKYEENLPKVPNIEASKAIMILPGLIWNGCAPFTMLTVHGAPGNASQSMRRRTYVTRWTETMSSIILVQIL